MKGGMLMKSKHIATYGEEIAHSNFRNYHIFDNFLYKSRECEKKSVKNNPSMIEYK